MILLERGAALLEMSLAWVTSARSSSSSSSPSSCLISPGSISFSALAFLFFGLRLFFACSHCTRSDGFRRTISSLPAFFPCILLTYSPRLGIARPACRALPFRIALCLHLLILPFVAQTGVGRCHERPAPVSLLSSSHPFPSHLVRPHSELTHLLRFSLPFPSPPHFFREANAPCTVLRIVPTPCTNALASSPCPLMLASPPSCWVPSSPRTAVGCAGSCMFFVLFFYQFVFCHARNSLASITGSSTPSLALTLPLPPPPMLSLLRSLNAL